MCEGKTRMLRTAHTLKLAVTNDILRHHFRFLPCKYIRDIGLIVSDITKNMRNQGKIIDSIIIFSSFPNKFWPKNVKY